MAPLASITSILYEQPLDLPVFNPVALDLLQLVEQPETDYFAIIAAIKEDQALAAMVLRMANSPSYAGLVSCDTIEKAAIRLGTHQIANLAVAASHASLHQSPDPVVNSIMQDLWLHSHACALGCQSIASRAGHQRLADRGYLAGLLHDIGKLYVLKALEEAVSHGELPAVGHDMIVTCLETLHVLMGSRLMHYYNLPELYGTVVAQHHTDYTDDDVIVDRVLTIVRMVNYSSRRFQLNSYPTSDRFDNVTLFADRLGVHEADMEMLEDAMISSRNHFC